MHYNVTKCTIMLLISCVVCRASSCNGRCKGNDQNLHPDLSQGCVTSDEHKHYKREVCVRLFLWMETSQQTSIGVLYNLDPEPV